MAETSITEFTGMKHPDRRQPYAALCPRVRRSREAETNNSLAVLLN